MSSHRRSGSDQSDRPTLPAIHDIFREELSQSPRPRPSRPLIDSPTLLFSRLSCCDEDGACSRPIADDQRSSNNHTERLERPVVQRSLPTPLCNKLSTRPRSSTTSPTLVHPGTDRTANYLPSHSFSSSHYKSKSSNDVPVRGGAPPPGATYHTPSNHGPSNTLRLSRPSFPAVPPTHMSYPTGGSPYDSRISRHSNIDQVPTQESPGSQAMGSGIMDRSRQEASASTSTVSKYECSYCGKGFNRPSSLRIHLNSHTGEKPFTCPFEGCGRSFSVLSNMRRHARVHTSCREDSSDEVSDKPSPPPQQAPPIQQR